MDMYLAVAADRAEVSDEEEVADRHGQGNDGRPLERGLSSVERGLGDRSLVLLSLRLRRLPPVGKLGHVGVFAELAARLLQVGDVVLELGSAVPQDRGLRLVQAGDLA